VKKINAKEASINGKGILNLEKIKFSEQSKIYLWKHTSDQENFESHNQDFALYKESKIVRIRIKNKFNIRREYCQD
jgi:hypothetical protein